MKKDLNYYLSLKYPIEIREDEDGAFVVSNSDLPGCASFGDTVEESLANLSEVRRLWVEGRLLGGQTVPEPAELQTYSGKFVLRIPRWLHQSLDSEAKRQSVSLNAYICSLLAERNAASIMERTCKAVLTLSRRPQHELAGNELVWNWVSNAQIGFTGLAFMPHPKTTTMLKLTGGKTNERQKVEDPFNQLAHCGNYD